MKNNFWVVEAAVKKKFKICFDGNVTREEAIEMFEEGDYEDIIDESDILEVIEVMDAE